MKPPCFFNSLAIESVGDDDGHWRLTKALIYASVVADTTYVVPRGFETDLSSVPRIPLIYDAVGGVARRAAVIHDWLYKSGQASRKVADAVFREAAAADGVSGWQRWLMWAGVRIGGGRHYKKG